MQKPITTALLIAMLCAGCGAGSAPPDGGSADIQGGGTDLGGGMPGTVDLDGRIVALDGQPLAGVLVSLCDGACRDVTTGAKGEFAFAGVPQRFHTLRARKTGASDYAELAFPLYVHEANNPHLLPLVLPRTGAGQPIAAGPQTFAVDGALSLSLDGDALALPGGGAPSRLGGVRVPKDLFPNFCVPSAHVIAMWAFAPTGIASTPPVGVHVGDTLGLTPGASVSLIEIDPATGMPSSAASATVSQDGKTLDTAPGAGIHRIGWLLFAVFSGGA